ncbi:hypothetical protein [Citricoccus alkalitolerans]|uniref:Uncharacterized protein n=1 Tax=Citricoccus alkalitolerans TaxID=246603 RepID=A0ABV8XV90_9MICC
MTGTVAIYGTGLGLLDHLADDLHNYGVRVIRAHHPHHHRTHRRTLLGVAYKWRRGWVGNALSRLKLKRSLTNIEHLISQNGIVLILVQLIGVPARHLESVLEHLSRIAEEATARMTNFHGLDVTINMLAFESSAQRSLLRANVLDYLGNSGRIASGECVHYRELKNRSLQDALNNHVL